jgi:translation initiation factor 4G
LENIIRAGQQTLPSRVRFLLQDVVDLRRNQWKPRREKAGPKTLDQIHKEAEREKTAKKLMEMQPLPNHNQGGGGGHNRGQGGGRDDNRNKRGASRGGGQGQGQGGGADDDWNTVSRRGNNPNFNEKIDAQKVISLATSGKKDADSITLGLGPANRGWGKGSGSAAKSPHPAQQGNRFAAIQDRQAEADARDAGGPRRGYSASMGNFNRQGSASRGSSVDERQSALSAVKQFSTNGPSPSGGAGGPMGSKGMPSSHSSNVISANSTGNNAGGMVSGGPSMSMSSMAHMQAPSTVIEAQAMASQTKMLKGAKDLVDDRVRQKATSIVDECLHLGNTQSALDDICADFHPDHMKDVAEYVLLHVIEKKLKDIQKTGELLDYLVTKHALLPSQLENAFYIILDMSADLEIDIPKLWENVSMLLAPVLASEKSLPMKFLLESVKHLDENQVPKFLKSVLKSLVEIKGHQKVDEMWTRSGLSISQLLPSNKLDKLPEIIKDTGLTSLTPTPNDQPQDVRSNLDRLLSDPRFDKNSEQKNDVISWIEDNVPAADRDGTAKNFLRTLARAVTGSSLNYDTNRREYSLEESKLEARCPLVKKYVDANTDREKQVLYALQHMMHEMEHPNKLLTNIFNCLYNNDVIAQEGFEAWLDCSEVSEQEGKGVAIKSTTHFFTWMRENEVDDEEP